jgi:hypothetical protein
VRRVGSAVAALCASACIGSSPLPLPEEAAEARSALIAFVAGDEAELYAVDLTSEPFPAVTIGHEALYLFLYGTELATLGIPAGRQETLTSTDGRPLPEGSIYVAALPETEWAPSDEEALPAPIRDFRLPDLAIGPCEAGGGCFRIREGDEYCQLPCVEPFEADPAPPSPAAPPEPPLLEPCPEGWSGERCAPVTIACGGGTQYLGDLFCSNAGGDCPPGDHREDLPAGPRRYVERGGSIQDAIAAASDGDVISVAKGVYAGPISIDRRVAVIGACAETIVTSPIVVSADATLGSLSVTPGFGSSGIRVAAGATATIEDVVVSSAAIGLEVLGTVRGERVMLSARRGIEAEGVVELDRTVVRGGDVSGVSVRGSGTFTNLRVSSSGEAVVAGGEASLELLSVHLASNQSGLIARGDAVVVARGVLISRAAVNALAVEERASLTVRKVHAIDNGQSLVGSGGTALVEDAYFDRPGAHHVVSAGPTSLALDRAVLSGSVRFGVWATEGRVMLENVLIRDNLASNNDGEGIVVDGPVILEARKLAIERVFDFGIRVLTRGEDKAELRLEDLTLRDIEGYGLEMGLTYAPAVRSTLSIHRLLAERTARFAVRSVSGEAHEITDAVLRDLPAGGISTIGGVLSLTRAELSRIDGPSVSVTSGEIRLSDIRILEPEDGLVTEGWTPTDVSAIDAAMNVDRFWISGASQTGVLVRQFSRMTFGAGRIDGNRIGVEVRADGFVYSNLEGDVIYRGNMLHNLLKTGQMPQ